MIFVVLHGHFVGHCKMIQNRSEYYGGLLLGSQNQVKAAWPWQDVHPSSGMHVPDSAQLL